MAEIVASGVLPLRPELRPDSSTRLAISFACSGSPAWRSTSIATCFAGSPLVVVCFAIVMASFSLWVPVGGAARRSRCRRRSAILLRVRVRCPLAWRRRLRSGQRQSGPPASQSMQRTFWPSRLKPWRSGIAVSGRLEQPLVAVAGLATLDEQDAGRGRLPVAAQIRWLVGRLDDGGDRVLERPGGLRQEADLRLAVATFEFVAQFLGGHCSSLRGCWLAVAGGKAPCLARGRGGEERFGLGEELAELLADLAAPGLAFLPLVGVEAEGGVGFPVAEPALDVDDGDVERDQHAGVAVAEVVQGRLRRRELGGLDRALERLAGDLAHESGLVAAGEDERARVEQPPAFFDEGEQPPHQLRRDVDRPLRLLGLERRPLAVAVELALDPDQGVLAVEVADGEPERLADAEPGREHQLEQAAVLLAVGVREERLHLLEREDSLRPLVVVAGALAALELGERVDGDTAAAGGLGEDDRERPQRARDRPALEPLAAHGGDQGGHVVASDLVEPAAAEPGDQVLLERPGVDLPRARADVLALEPLAGVLLECLPCRLDSLAAAAAQAQLGPLGLGVVEASVHDRPAALAARVEVGHLVGRLHLAARARPVVDAGMAGDRPAPRAGVTLGLHRS